MNTRDGETDGTRVRHLRIGTEQLVVVSYPIQSADFTRLSDAEAEVGRLVVRGFSNAEIAVVRGTSVRTVANQMASILRKLGLASRRELASGWGSAG